MSVGTRTIAMMQRLYESLVKYFVEAKFGVNAEISLKY